MILMYVFYDCDQLTAFYGYADTYAEAFAKEQGYYFEVLQPEETEETIS